MFYSIGIQYCVSGKWVVFLGSEYFFSLSVYWIGSTQIEDVWISDPFFQLFSHITKSKEMTAKALPDSQPTTVKLCA